MGIFIIKIFSAPSILYALDNSRCIKNFASKLSDYFGANKVHGIILK